MDDRRTDAAPNPPAMTILQEPTRRAHPRLVLTPVPAPRTAFEPSPRAVRAMVAGAAALVIVVEMRRLDTPARPAVLCSAAALAMAAAHWRKGPPC